MRKSIGLIVLALLVGTLFCMTCGIDAASAEADLSGKYEVSGWDPDSDFGSRPAYSGTVRLKRKGEIYQFEGLVDGEKYVGVGLYLPNKGILSIAFQERKTGEIGQTVLEVKGDSLEGRWSYLDNEQGSIGREVWKRVK